MYAGSVPRDQQAFQLFRCRDFAAAYQDHAVTVGQGLVRTCREAVENNDVRIRFDAVAHFEQTGACRYVVKYFVDPYLHEKGLKKQKVAMRDLGRTPQFCCYAASLRRYDPDQVQRVVPRAGTLSFSTPPGLNYFPTSKNGRETVAMCLQNKLAAGQGLRQCLTWIIAAGSVVDAGSRNLDGFACRLMLSPAAGYG
jgi:hypothetical protein